MFHISNLGYFGRDLDCYADMDGFLPESADELLKMNYDLCGEELDENGQWDKDLREEWFEDAETAIQEALENLAKQQEENS